MSGDADVRAVLADIVAAIALLDAALTRAPKHRPTSLAEHRALLQLDREMDELVDALLDLRNTIRPPVGGQEAQKALSR